MVTNQGAGYRALVERRAGSVALNRLLCFVVILFEARLFLCFLKPGLLSLGLLFEPGQCESGSYFFNRCFISLFRGSLNKHGSYENETLTTGLCLNSEQSEP
jgi:hypothetical protein